VYICVSISLIDYFFFFSTRSPHADTVRKVPDRHHTVSQVPRGVPQLSLHPLHRCCQQFWHRPGHACPAQCRCRCHGSPCSNASTFPGPHPCRWNW
jgi:hypothetical protein